MGLAILHGLKIVAVAVVAQAVWSMARKLCPDWQRIAIAFTTGIIMLGLSGAYTQIIVIIAGALAGLVLCRGQATAITDKFATALSSRVGAISLIAFLIFIVGLFQPFIRGFARVNGTITLRR